MDLKLYADLLNLGYDTLLAQIISICFKRCNISKEKILEHDHIRITNYYAFIIMVCMNRHKVLKHLYCRYQKTNFHVKDKYNWNKFLVELKNKKDNDSQKLYHFCSEGCDVSSD